MAAVKLAFSHQPPAASTGIDGRQGQRGQALVELAIVLPILLLLIMAIIDFGRVFHGYLAVTTAAREGARQAALGATDVEIQETALQAATPLAPELLGVVVTPAYGARYPGTNIEVRVNYQMSILTPIMQSIFPNPYIVTGQAVMKKE